MAKHPANFSATSQAVLTTAFRWLPPQVRGLGAFCLFLAAFTVAYQYGMAFSPQLSAPFWFPDTVLLTALLLTRPKYWWLLLLSTLPLRLFFVSPPDSHLWFRLAAFANDSLKAAASAALVRRFIPDLSKLGQLREAGFFVVFAVILVPALSATLGAACRHALGFEYWKAWVQWFLGNALTNLVLTSAVLHWLDFLARPSTPVSRRHKLEGACLLVLLSVALFLAFGGNVESVGHSAMLVYSPVPFLLWAAVRFGSIGASTALSIVACHSIWSAAHGHGPFSAQSMEEDVLAIQLYLFVVGVPILGLAAVLEDWGRVGAALRASEERYREVVESQTDLVCRYLPDTTLTFVNEAYCQFFQRSREELIGRQFLEWIPEASLEVVRQSVAALVADRATRSYEHEVVLPHGGVGWQHWIDYVIVDDDGQVRECQGIGRDITERKLAEEALRVSEERMFLAAEAAEMGFWMCDISGGEIGITERRRESGLAPSGRTPFDRFLDRVHHDDRTILDTAMRRAFAGQESLENEYRIVQPNGDIRWQASRGHCLRNGDGKVNQIVGVSMDITARKRSEEMMQNFVHATRLALVGEMTASIAHEMNQPLGAILSNADAAEMLLEQEVPPIEQIREILADIRKDDLRASGVIRHLRSLLRKQDLKLQPIALNEVVTDALRLVAGDARLREVTLDHQLAPDLGEVDGDPVHLQQVMLNLMLNGMDAMKATPLAIKRLVISTRRHDGGSVELAVTDAGHGIAPDRLGRVFDSFFTTKEDGMGLGLAIASSIIETHRGRIWAQNNPDRAGATFYFTLPSKK